MFFVYRMGVQFLDGPLHVGGHSYNEGKKYDTQLLLLLIKNSSYQKFDKNVSYFRLVIY